MVIVLSLIIDSFNFVIFMFIGRPPAEELPQIPFGLVPTSPIPSSKDALGIRMPLSEKEREISTTRIMHIEANQEASGKGNTSHERPGHISKQVSVVEGGMYTILKAPITSSKYD